jgi:hypothetical protein
MVPLFKYFFMKTYECMKVQRHIYLILALDRVSDQLQSFCRFTREKDLHYLLDRWLGGCWSWTEGCEEGCWKSSRIESSLVEFSLSHQDATYSDGRHRLTRLDSAAVPAVRLKYLSLSEIHPSSIGPQLPFSLSYLGSPISEMGKQSIAIS